MDIALGMMIGAFISIISIFFTMNHIVTEDKKKNSPNPYPAAAGMALIVNGVPNGYSNSVDTVS